MINSNENKNKLNSTNVVYHFISSNEDCILLKINYIGSATTAQSRRLTIHLINLTMHLTNWIRREHKIWTHYLTLTSELNVNNASIVC